MIVRVLTPKKLDLSDMSDMNTAEQEFPFMPVPGQVIRTSDWAAPDFEVERTGFIETYEGFVPAVWIKRDEAVDKWIREG